MEQNMDIEVDKSQLAGQKSAHESYQHQPLHILNLNLDCLNEILALLSLEDLHSVCESCKVLQQIVGSYFQHNYKTLKIWINYNAFRLDQLQLVLNGFSEYIENICIDDSIENFRFAEANCSLNLKKIYFHVVHFTEAKIQCMKRILSNVEIIMLSECHIENDLYGNFLRFCVKLRRLSVVFYEDFPNQWLYEFYPQLEYLKLAGQITFSFIDVQWFFRNNPNCTSFWIDARYLLENQEALLDSNLQWIDLTSCITPNHADNVYDFIVLLKELHERGAYQRLHLFLNGKEWDELFFRALSSVPALVNLCLEYFDNYNLSELPNLEKLEVYMPLNVTVEKLESLAINLLNLERIAFGEASLAEILPFFSHAKKLREVRVHTLKDGGVVRGGPLNVHVLNAARESLNGARKVTMYVDETVFLKTRWANVQANFNYIEIRRMSAYQDNSFYASYL